MILLSSRFGRKVPLDEHGRPPNPMAPGWLRAFAARSEGYEIVRAEDTVDKTVRTTTAEARFRSLEAAARGGAFYSATVALKRETRTSEDKGAKPREVWRLTLKDGITGHPELGKLDPTAIVRLLEPQLASARAERVLRLPTRVIETNGTLSKDRRVVRWTRDYKQVVKEGQVLLEVVFESAPELKLEPFTYKPALAELLRRSIAFPPEPAKPSTPKPAKPK